MYIVVVFGPPYTSESRPKQIKKLRRYEILLQTWKDHHLFSSSTSFECAPTSVPEFSTLQRLLAKTLYNPVDSIMTEWIEIGPFDQTALINAVTKGLERDDDIITQWFDANDVTMLLNRAVDWQELLLAVDAINGAHVDTPDVREYVNRTLGNAG